MNNRNDIDRYERNFRDELDGAALYAALAAAAVTYGSGAALGISIR